MQQLPPALPPIAPRLVNGHTDRMRPGYQQHRLDDWALRLAIAQTRRTAGTAKAVAAVMITGLLVLGSCALFGCQREDPKKAIEKSEELSQRAKALVDRITRR